MRGSCAAHAQRTRGIPLHRQTGRRSTSGARLAPIRLTVRPEPQIRRPAAATFLAMFLSTFTACEGVGSPARVDVPADSAAGQVTFRFVGPGGAAMVLPAYINGHGPIDLVMDTGSTLTCVDDSLARELALPVRKGAIGVGTTVIGMGSLRLLQVDSLRVGGARAEDLMVCSLDTQSLRALGANVRGLLGLNFLRNFRVGIDFRTHIITFTSPGR